MIRRPPRSTLFPYTDALPISESRGRSHCVVVIWIFRLELDSSFERVSRFCNKAQIRTHDAKVVMQARIARLQVPCMRQVAKGPLMVFLEPGNSCQFP